jgi:RNA polymerase sigma-70 factor (ECF subfamily)
LGGVHLDELILIKNLKKGRQSGKGGTTALEKLIDIYAGYVTVIVKNIIGAYMSEEDIEEAVSDVFLSVWNNSDKINTDEEFISVKAYIAAIARNTAKNKLRELRPHESLPDDEILIDDSSFYEQSIRIEAAEQKEIINEALLKMNEEERNIFLRYYYYYEKIADISRALSINESTIKSRLSRGRKHIKQAFAERGYICEDED